MSIKLSCLPAAALALSLTATAVYAGVTAFDEGTVNPADFPNMAQPSPIATSTNSGATWTAGPNTTLVQGRFGQAAPNPGQGNNGWDPWGQGGSGGYAGILDISHSWINIGTSNAAGLFALSGTELRVVWGSPNNDNTVTFYSDPAGQDPIGAIDQNALFGSNTGAPGYLTLFATTLKFESVSFSATNGSAFEFAVVPVPELSTWAMMGLGFAGLALAGYRARRAPVAAL